MLIELPETQTVSTRLTVPDYKAFRSLCQATGTTMHKIVRLLIGYWMIQKSREYRTPVRVSSRLYSQVERERDSKDSVFPEEVRLTAKAAAVMEAVQRVSESVDKSLR